MGDFLAFRRMLLPVLLQLIFWLGVLACIGAGVYVILLDTAQLQAAMPATGLTITTQQVTEFKLYAGLIVIIGGPLVLRLVFELILLPFRINSTLTEIRKALLAQNQKAAAPTTVSHSVPQSEPAPLRRR